MKNGVRVSWWKLEHKQHSSVVCHLIRVQFLVSQNNYNINIKSHQSQMTIANAIKIVRELQNEAQKQGGIQQLLLEN